MEPKLKVVAIIQARMGSTRLPGKVLSLIEGEPLLQILISRIRQVESIDYIVVATTTDSNDDDICNWCIQNGIDFFRGESNDVLSRFFFCASAFQADVIVRITADDPLKDPCVINRAISLFKSDVDLDYVSNTLTPTYPEGLDVEVFGMSALTRAFHQAELLSDREHVTPYIWRQPESFVCLNFQHDVDYSFIRLTIDYDVDLDFIRQLVSLTPGGLYGSMQDYVATVDEYPALRLLNGGITRNQGYIDSIKSELDGGML